MSECPIILSDSSDNRELKFNPTDCTSNQPKPTKPNSILPILKLSKVNLIMPSKMEAPESAKTITVFVNGDSNYSGKKFVVNRKRTPTFDTLLGDVSTFEHCLFDFCKIVLCDFNRQNEFSRLVKHTMNEIIY